jgi:hypothetical protein
VDGYCFNLWRNGVLLPLPSYPFNIGRELR